MIKLEITESSDPFSLGIYNYLYDQVFVGRSKKCDLIFLEKHIPLKFLTLTANDNSLVVQSEPGAPPFFINGKKTSGAFKLKANDILMVGPHFIKVLEYRRTQEQIDLSPFYEKVSSAAPEVRDALSFLENKLIALEEAN